jgi:hypothetical protein
LLPECFSKQWKISSTTISTIALALKTFGHKHVPLKPILKEVAKMFEDSNAKVREEAQKLMIEMYRWAGAALKPTVDTLRPAQAKDLNTAFEALPQAKAVPEKRLRCEQPQDDEEEAPAGRGAGGGGGGGGEDEDEEAGGMDAYELAEPVDILSKLPGDWYDKVVRRCVTTTTTTTTTIASSTRNRSAHSHSAAFDFRTTGFDQVEGEERTDGRPAFAPQHSTIAAWRLPGAHQDDQKGFTTHHLCRLVHQS